MIRIGSRGSALALWQAEHIAAALRGRGSQVAIQVLVTTGDRMQQAPFMQVGAKGMFTREIEEALAEGSIDLAVHSLKDLPTELPPGFVLAAIPHRADARDAFVSTQYASHVELPANAVVGTSSLRRQAMLRALRPDVEVRELRGNVDTRLRKLQDGRYDAIVLAAAGLDRLQRTEWVRSRFSAEEMCPAAGQGALAIECRIGDTATLAVVAGLDDAATRFAVTVERAALATLEGGCHVPVGVHCAPAASGWRVTAVVAHPGGAKILRERMDLNGSDDGPETAQRAGRAIALRLLDRGAGEMLAAAGPVPESTAGNTFE